MNHSTFEQPLPPSLIDDMAEGYNHVNAEYIKASFEFVVGSPAGALSATGLDMANFMIAHLQDGRFKDTQILSPETTQQMHSPLYRPDPQLDGMAIQTLLLVYPTYFLECQQILTSSYSSQR